MSSQDISFSRADEVLIFPETGLVAGVKKIQDKPDEIKRVIRAGVKANRHIRANRDGAVQFLMDWLKRSAQNDIHSSCHPERGKDLL